jgi:hypothetical protein
MAGHKNKTLHPASQREIIESPYLSYILFKKFHDNPPFLKMGIKIPLTPKNEWY